MEDRGPVNLGKRLVHRPGNSPCEMDVYDIGDGHYTGYRWLASNPQAVPLQRKHGEFYEQIERRNEHNFKQGEWVILHVKDPYEYEMGNRQVRLERVYSTNVDLVNGEPRFTAYGITDELHQLLMEKQKKGEVLFERPGRHATP